MLTCLESRTQVIQTENMSKDTSWNHMVLSIVNIFIFDEVGRVFMFVTKGNFHQSASRLPMMRVPPKVWVGPTCLQVTRHAPQTPPPPLQDLFSVSSAVETGADNSEELLRKYRGSAVIPPHEPEHSSDKSRVKKLSVRRIPVKPGAYAGSQDPSFFGVGPGNRK